MTKWFFQKPFPLSTSGSRSLIFALLAGIFVGLFLILFQPFGTYEWQHPHKFFLLSGFGFVTFTILVFNAFVIRKLFRNFYREENWTTGKEVFNEVFIILTISTGNYFYSLWINDRLASGNFHWSHFLFILWTTFIIGIFPSIAFTFYNQQRLVQKFQNPPQPPSLPGSSLLSDEENVIQLKSDNGREVLQVPISRFLYVESANNYVEVFFLNDSGNLQKELLRAGLSRLESEVSYPFIVRCHRSFMINLHQVAKVTGNAQGYRLHFKETGLSVPVGRTNSDAIMDKLKNLPH